MGTSKLSLCLVAPPGEGAAVRFAAFVFCMAGVVRLSFTMMYNMDRCSGEVGSRRGGPPTVWYQLRPPLAAAPTLGASIAIDPCCYSFRPAASSYLHI